MPKFNNREEYEQWKAERIRQAAQKAATPDSDKGLSESPPEITRRPLESRKLSGIGELFGLAWNVYKKRFLTLIVLCLLMIILFALPLAVFGGGGYALALILPEMKAVLIGVFITIGIIISTVTLLWGISGLLCAVTDDSLTIKDALSRGWPRIWGLMWLLTVFGFLVTGGYLLFFIPGILFTVWFTFGQFIFVEEDERGMRALLKSKELVRGYGLGVFGRLLLVWLISGILGIIPVVGSILSFLFVPFVLIFSFLLYRELKALKGDVAFPIGMGEKIKWIGTAALGYILVPILIVVIFGASLLSSLILLKGMISSRGITAFSSAPPIIEKAAPPQSDVVRPSNFNELLGTWSGKEINGGSGWTFSFSDGYNVHAVDPGGNWYKGKVGIHWRLGGDERGLQVPPGAGVFDVDIEESSSVEYTGKTSVGAFAIYGDILKLCSGEPGKTKRPESFEPTSGIRCFELAKTSGPPPPASSQVLSQPAPAHTASSVDDEEIRTARAGYKRCAESYRSGNIAEAKRCFSQSTLNEMERNGQIEMGIGIMTRVNIDEFQARHEGNRITFTQSKKDGDATMSMSFTMVKEDNQWKMGD